MTAWYACEQPERPTDPAVRWHYRNCRPCRVKAQAVALQHPDDPHVAWLNGVLGAGDTEEAGTRDELED